MDLSLIPLDISFARSKSLSVTPLRDAAFAAAGAVVAAAVAAVAVAAFGVGDCLPIDLSSVCRTIAIFQSFVTSFHWPVK